MSETGTGEGARKSAGIGTMRRKAVDVTKLVETSTIDGNPLPLIVRPAMEGVDLAEWAASHRDEVEAWFNVHGAVLFRGFPLDGVDDFERVAGAVAGELFADYGDLPPQPTSEKIYESTPYPADKMILFHNESSHLPTWPMRSVLPLRHSVRDRAARRRCSTRARCSTHIDPGAPSRQFETKGLMYVRNFSKGIDVPWQEFFHTTDRAKVEQMCRDAGMIFEWTAPTALRVINRSRRRS